MFDECPAYPGVARGHGDNANIGSRHAFSPHSADAVADILATDADLIVYWLHFTPYLPWKP